MLDYTNMDEMVPHYFNGEHSCICVSLPLIFPFHLGMMKSIFFITVHPRDTTDSRRADMHESRHVQFNIVTAETRCDMQCFNTLSRRLHIEIHTYTERTVELWSAI